MNTQLEQLAALLGHTGYTIDRWLYSSPGPEIILALCCGRVTVSSERRGNFTCEKCGKLMAPVQIRNDAAGATCIRCGCTDNRACEGHEPCGWAVVDRARGIGICTSCCQPLVVVA